MMLQINGYREVIVPAVRALVVHFGETVHVVVFERENVVYVVSECLFGGVVVPLVLVVAEFTLFG